jgi:hypothetical protein
MKPLETMKGYAWLALFALWFWFFFIWPLTSDG